jgi:hypothetical protein
MASEREARHGNLPCFYAGGAVLVFLPCALGVNYQSEGSTAMGSVGLAAYEQQQVLEVYGARGLVHRSANALARKHWTWFTSDAVSPSNDPAMGLVSG